MHRQLQNLKKKCNIKLKIAKLCVDKSVNLGHLVIHNCFENSSGNIFTNMFFYLMLNYLMILIEIPL